MHILNTCTIMGYEILKSII